MRRESRLLTAKQLNGVYVSRSSYSMEDIKACIQHSASDEVILLKVSASLPVPIKWRRLLDPLLGCCLLL